MLTLLVRFRPALVGLALTLLAAGPASALGTGTPICPNAMPASGMYFLCFDDLDGYGVQGAISALPPGFMTGLAGINDATVLSESELASAFGLDTSAWATTRDRGILNDLEPIVEFSFNLALIGFRIDVVGLPGLNGPIVAQGLLGNQPVVAATSDSGVPVAGTDALRLTLGGGVFDRVLLFGAAGPCQGFDCEPDLDALFFADTLKITVPEPTTVVLVAVVLATLGFGRRRS